MSNRFAGWTSQAITKLQLKQSGSDEKAAIALKEKRARARNLLKGGGGKHSPQLNKALRDALNKKTGNADKIGQALCSMQIPHKKEFQFDPKRKFRFDYAIPDHKIAVEYEGGVYKGGRHTRTKGYARDAQKYNLALKLGWKVLRYTAIDAEIDNWEYKVVLDVQKEMEKSKTVVPLSLLMRQTI